MEVNQIKTVPVQAKTLRMCLKVCDQFGADILDENGAILGGQDDVYVPSFMPGQHYGDYVMLDIDLDTGMVTNWEKPSSTEIEEFIGCASGDPR
jgi:hypothetical protein